MQKSVIRKERSSIRRRVWGEGRVSGKTENDKPSSERDEEKENDKRKN